MILLVVLPVLFVAEEEVDELWLSLFPMALTVPRTSDVLVGRATAPMDERLTTNLSLQKNYDWPRGYVRGVRLLGKYRKDGTKTGVGDGERGHQNRGGGWGVRHIGGRGFAC